MAKRFDFVIEGLTDRQLEILTDVFLALIKAMGGECGGSIREVEINEEIAKEMS